MAENKCGDIYGQIESDPTIDNNLIPSYPRSIYDSNWVHKMKEKKEYEATNKFFSVPVFWKDK